VKSFAPDKKQDKSQKVEAKKKTGKRQDISPKRLANFAQTRKHPSDQYEQNKPSRSGVRKNDLCGSYNASHAFDVNSVPLVVLVLHCCFALLVLSPVGSISPPVIIYFLLCALKQLLLQTR
jgi:hypothetical protein